MHEITRACGLPALNPFNEAWFTSGKVAVQRCDECGTLQHPPEEICHTCGASVFGVREMSPRGTVVSYTVAHHAPSSALAEVVPYTIVLVSLDDAPHLRVVGNLEGEVHVGMPVVACWEHYEVADEQQIQQIELIQWRRAPTSR